MKLSFNTLFDIFQTTRLWLLILRLCVLLAFFTVASTLKLPLFWFILPLSYFVFLIWAAYDHLAHSLRFFFALIVDIHVISLVLILADGVMSGWVSFLILPALIGCLSLERIYAWCVALLSVLYYGVLIWSSAEPEFALFGVEWFHYRQHETMASHRHDMTEMEQHMWGMWLTFSISITLMTAFLVQQRAVASAYQQSMIKMQQQFAREQQVLAVASLTANTTHQLASPLSTARMLLEELEDKSVAEQDKTQNLHLIKQELNRCSAILTAMMEKSATSYITEEKQCLEFVPWFKALLSAWWNGHNEIDLKLTGESDCEGLRVSVDQNLTFAFNNVLDNINKALLNDDNHQVTISLDVITGNSRHNQIISVEMQYSGCPPSGEVIEFLGKRIVKSKDGMGIGAILAQTAVERVDGSLEYFWHDDGQCRVSVLLPVVGGDDR